MSCNKVIHCSMRMVSKYSVALIFIFAITILPVNSLDYTSSGFSNFINNDYSSIKDAPSSFDFGEEFFVDEIIDELQKMGLRPTNRANKCSGPSCPFEQKKDEPVPVVQFNFESTDDEQHRIQERSADVSDILNEPIKGERQARLFYNFDRGSAFNTSVAFTIPLFSFTLPGAGDITDDGLDGNVFGTMAFVSLFLLGGLGVAIYTTTQGAVGADGGARTLHSGPKFSGSEAPFSGAVLDGVAEFISTLDLPSCSHLAVCQAYQQPDNYGFMATPFKIWAPLKPDVPLSELRIEEAAARHGADGGNCRRKYSCIVDPIDALDLAYDMIVSNYL